MKRIVSAILVTPLAFYAGAPAGTPIAKISVPIQPPGSFGGGLSITGSNKADFRPPVKNADGTYMLLSAIVIPANWSPSIYLVAQWSAIANSPYVGGPYVFGADPTPVPSPPPPPLPPQAVGPVYVANLARTPLRRRRKAISALAHTMFLIAP